MRLARSLELSFILCLSLVLHIHCHLLRLLLKRLLTLIPCLAVLPPASSRVSPRDRHSSLFTGFSTSMLPCSNRSLERFFQNANLTLPRTPPPPQKRYHLVWHLSASCFSSTFCSLVGPSPSPEGATSHAPLPPTVGLLHALFPPPTPLIPTPRSPLSFLSLPRGGLPGPWPGAALLLLFPPDTSDPLTAHTHPVVTV